MSALTIAASVVAAAGAVTASADTEDLGPAPEVCNAYAPAPLCFYAAVAGTNTFNLSGHLLFVGETLSGTYRWRFGGQGNGEFPAFVSVAVNAGGPGLKLVHCHGKRHDNNSDAKYQSPHSGDITAGHASCTWKAVAATNGWVNGPGLSVAAGGQAYTAGDFYAVLSKGGAIEGHVREQNVLKKVEDLTGIAGVKVHITGPHNYSKTVTTSGTGYYNAIVPRAGSYEVKPAAPKGYGKDDKPARSDPESSKVEVQEEKTAQADFTYKSSLKLTIHLDRTSVPADGQSFVTATIKATDAGKPVPSQPFSLRPYGGGSALESPYKLAVPATICPASATAVSGRVWPDPTDKKPNTASVNQMTDSTGQMTYRIYTGTVPGTFPLSVWAEDGAGKLITQNVNDVSDDADITVKHTEGGGDPPTVLHDWLNAPGNAKLADTLPTAPQNLVTTLAEAMSGSGDLRHRAFVLTPVQSAKGFNGLLLSAEGSRLKFVDPDKGEISPSSEGFLLTPTNLNGSSLYAGGFWGYIKTTAHPAGFAKLAPWLANAVPGYAFPGNGGPITLLGATGLQYAGFGYGPTCT